MNINGLPSLVQTQIQQSNVTDTRQRMLDVQIEATTGKLADIAKSLRGEIGQVQRLEKLVADNQSYLQSISLTATRFETIQSTLSSISERTNLVAVEVIASTGLEDQVSLEQQTISARAEFDAIVGSLNATIAGRSLFSGAATDTAPIADPEALLADISAIVGGTTDAATALANVDAYFAPGGTFETTIYQGSTNTSPSTEVASGRRVVADVKAIDPEIKNVLANLAVIAVGFNAAATPEESNELLSQAGERLRDASLSVTDRQSALGGQQEELELTRVRNEAETFAYEQSLAALTTRDQFEAAAELQALVNQLTAIFETTARIANLTYTNFIR